MSKAKWTLGAVAVAVIYGCGGGGGFTDIGNGGGVLTDAQKLNTEAANNNYAAVSARTNFTANLPVQTAANIDVSREGTFFHRPNADTLALVEVVRSGNSMLVNQAKFKLNAINTTTGGVGPNSTASYWQTTPNGYSGGNRPLQSGAVQTAVSSWVNKFGAVTGFAVTNAVKELDAATADDRSFSIALDRVLKTQGVNIDVANIVIGTPDEAIAGEYATPKNKFTHIKFVQEADPTVKTLQLSGNFGTPDAPDFVTFKVIDGKIDTFGDNGLRAQGVTWAPNGTTASTVQKVIDMVSALKKATTVPVPGAPAAKLRIGNGAPFVGQ